jgi:hypothetical protein
MMARDGGESTYEEREIYNQQIRKSEKSVKERIENFPTIA